LDALKSLHTFSLAANCKQLKIIDSVNSLITCVKDLAQSDVRYLVLGEGSNTVFISDYPYVVLLNRIKGIEVEETKHDYILSVGSGENWHQLVSFCIDKGIGGFENLALIPGTVGASPIQNIGAYGVEIQKFVEKVEFVDTTVFKQSSFLKEQCQFAYRDSVFKQQAQNHRIITKVIYRLPKLYALETSYGPLTHLHEPSAKDIYNQVIAIRKSKLPDPDVLGNAGSFFKNPVIENRLFTQLSNRYAEIPSYRINDQQVKIPAAWLIDTLGFKGKKVGDIGCHKDQALVLVNYGKGVGEDLLTLARQIRDDVLDSFSIQLETEVRLVGKKGLITL
jgi:UDP-N-acetylmuramate dehydrogenase